MRLQHATTQCPVAMQGDLQEHLVTGVTEGQYDRRVADFLACTAAIAYSDIRTFTDALCRFGLEGETVEISVKNRALLVDATAFVFQSRDKKLGIIALSGAEPTHVLNVMTDTSARKVPFLSEGYVHVGLCNNVMAVGLHLREFVAALYTGESLGKRLNELMPKDAGKRPESEVDNIGKGKQALKALYLTGHGMGGALAEMVAGGIYMDPKLEAVRPLVRGIYSYGPPRWADPSLAMSLDEKYGKKLFWFMYEKDIVTRMPTMVYGKYARFGRRYVSSSPGGVWVKDMRPLREIMTAWAAESVGTMTYVKDKIFGGRVVLPAAWADHSPLNYVRISRNSSPDLP